MKKLKTLGIVTTVFLVLMMSALGIAAAFGFFGEEKPEKGKTETDITAENINSDWIVPETGKTAVIKTDLGEIKIALSGSEAAEKFASLAKEGAFDGAEFKTLAENMFIQTETCGESFSAEKNEFACINGVIGFVSEDGETFPSLVIINSGELSGFSKAFLSESSFPEEKTAIYEKFGGIPEYEGKIVVFGKIISGSDIVEEIASGKNSGYTGGYSALEPVKIISAEIF